MLREDSECRAGCSRTYTGNPGGSVTFTQSVTASDALNNGQWYSANGTAQVVANNKEAGSKVQLTAGKNSKTLKIKARFISMTERQVSGEIHNCTDRQCFSI